MQVIKFVQSEMALLRTKFGEIPPDAVVLSEKQALQYQMKILKNWTHPLDVFAYRYGSYVLGGASFVTGLWINNYYRRKFKLFRYGRAASYLPVCVLPGVFSAMLHMEFVLTDVTLQKTQNCPVCLEMRASAIQSMLGTAFPFVLGNVSTLVLAHSYGTYNMPYITQEPMKIFKLVQSKAKPLLNILLAIFIGQALLASTITYFEAKSVYTVNEKLSQLEYELENSS